MFFGFGIKSDKKLMGIKKVVEYTGLSRSYIYYLREKGLLEGEVEVIDGRRIVKFKTESVIKLAETIETNHESKQELEKQWKGEARKRLANLRRYVGA